MRLDLAFHLGHYLTLGLAGICLAIALEPARPERAVVVCVLAGLFGIGLLLKASWMRGSRAEGGFKLALAALAGWATYAYLRHAVGQTTDIPSQKTNWGPPLLVSLPLLLPGVFLLKRLGPFWGLQGLGLTAVALSCAWGDDWRLEWLWPAYLLCGVWTLALFDLRRRQALAQVSGDAAPGHPGGTALRLPWRYLGAMQVACWALIAGVPAVILFLITADICIGEPDRLQTGLGDGQLDLNQTGTLHLSRTVALLVSVARADGSAGPALGPSQRFRGATLEVYEQGRWFNAELQAVGPPTVSPVETPDARLPYLGPRAVFLTFTPQRHPPRVPVLAEPVSLPLSREPLPVLTLADDGRRLPWSKLADGTLLPRIVPLQGSCRYLQVHVASAAARSFQPQPQYLEQLLRPAPHPIRNWTTALLARIAAQHRLTASDLRPDAAGNLPTESHEAVARALEAHLSRSGEYRYSWRLERRDPAIDPTADFLLNSKRGHCARYASALALMLRSQGIPARIVLGYSGAESRGEGVFLVRESSAHSWVEALVRRPGADGRSRWYWLTLDPTPGQAGNGTATAGDWHEGPVSWRAWLDSGSGERRMTAVTWMLDRAGLAPVVERASGRIEELRQGDWSWHDVWPWLVGAGVVWAAVWQLRRLRRRPVLFQPCEAPEYAFYYRLLEVLARRCRLRPQFAQTPREFSETAGQVLRGRGIASLAAVPRRVVALYYRLRYGRRPASDAERLDIEGEIGQLESALHGRPPRRPATVEKPAPAE